MEVETLHRRAITCFESLRIRIVQKAFAVHRPWAIGLVYLRIFTAPARPGPALAHRTHTPDH